MLKGKSRRLAALIAAVLLCLAAAAAEEFRLLQVGDSGEAVYQFKLRLYDLGYFSSQPTHSYFNELTEQRVKLFQKMNGLRQDGRATPELQALLFSDQAIDAAGRRVGEPSVSPEAPSPTPEPTVSPTAEPLSAEILLPSATPAQESPSEATFAPTQVPQGVPSPVPALGVVRGWDRQQGYQYVTLGSYPYEEDGTPRPVLWKVLGTENGQALLMSALILDTQQVMFSRESYYAAMEAHTFRRIKSFAESDLCAWMNGEMLDTLVGFGYLRDALVEGPYGRLYPLTTTQMTTTAYGFNPNIFGKSFPDRVAESTPYAKSVNHIGLDTWPEGRPVKRLYLEPGWTSSPYWVIGFKTSSVSGFGHEGAGEGDTWMQLCGYNGHISWGGFARTDVGVRPALTLDLRQIGILSGSGTESSPWSLTYYVE